MNHFNVAEAVKDQRARTRDGREVYELRECLLDGDPILMGCVTVHRSTDICRPTNGIIPVENMFWNGGGLGRNGSDDLLNY